MKLNIRADRNGKDWRPAFNALRDLIQETAPREARPALLALVAPSSGDPNTRFEKALQAYYHSLQD